MAGTPKQSTLQRRLELLERRVRIMERTSRLNSASIGEGGLTVRDGGDIFLEDAAGNIIWRASTDANVIRSRQRSIENTTLTPGWTPTSMRQVSVPEGYTQASVLMWAAVGATYASVGFCGVQPTLTVSGGPAQGGPAITSPESRIATVSSMWAVQLNDLTPGEIIDLVVYSYSQAHTANSGNIHMSAQVDFRRS
jgi:hypothetical protein